MKNVKRKLGWATWLLLLWALYYAGNPYVSEWVMRQEAAPTGYAVIADAYPSLSPALQATISEKFGKGYLSRSDVSATVMSIVDEKGSVQVSPAPDLGDGQASGLGPLDQALGKMQDSHAKRALARLTASGE